MHRILLTLAAVAGLMMGGLVGCDKGGDTKPAPAKKTDTKAPAKDAPATDDKKADTKDEK